MAGSAAGIASDASLDALSTANVALIDEELAEHLRWGAAASRVGAAGSATRARFLAEQADAGAMGGGAQALVTGAAMGAATRAIEIAGERAAIRLAGQAAGRAAPIPAIGAVIGGVMSAMDLAERDWGQTGQTIGRFGQGASDYDMLANSIAAVSEIISVYTALLNVIAGVIGAISIVMWIITIVTVGVASPLAATLSSIAAGIGIGTMILDAINALVLQPLIMTFRALHAFKSQADPTQVEEQGGQVRQAAASGAGFVGGFAGGLAGSHGATAAGRSMGLVPPHAPPTPHETPSAAAGDGPTIHADPPPPDAAPRPPETSQPAHAPDTAQPAAAPDAAQPTRQAGDPILPPADPNAPQPQVPGAPRMPDIPAPEPGVPREPDTHPVDPDRQTVPAPADPQTDPYRRTDPAPPPEVGELRMADDQAPAQPASAQAAPAPADAAAGAPGQQLSFGGDFEPQQPRRLSPDEVAPPDARSAFLRRLRAEAAGEPPPPVGTGPNNIARHLLPDAGPPNWRRSANTASPTPDLYQHVDRLPEGHQSHHVEQQSAFRGPNGDEVVAGYNPREDPTVMMSHPEHAQTFPPQRAQRLAPDFHESVGTPRALEEAYNIALWGDRNGPTSPNQVPLMDPRVAGQVVMEHSSYLFETSRLSGDIQGTGGPIRPGETPLSQRPTTQEVLGPMAAAPEPFEAFDWDRTFGLTDPNAPAVPQHNPAMLAQPPGTQFGLFGLHEPPQPREPQQLSLRFPEPPDTRQTELRFPEERTPPEGSGGDEGGGGTRDTALPDEATTSSAPDANDALPMADPAQQPPGPARPPMRSQQALGPQERANLLAMAQQMGYPPERVQFHDGPTSVLNGVLRIGPDINPLPPGQRPTGVPNPANLAVGPQGVLGHEIIGHLEARQAGQSQPTRAREEFQASTRAALHTPGLPPEEGALLRQDATARLRNEPPNAGTFYVYTDRPNAPQTQAPTPARPPGQFRPQDQLPSVMVDWNAVGVPPPEGAGATRTPQAQSPAPTPRAGPGSQSFAEPHPDTTRPVPRAAPAAPTIGGRVSGAVDSMRHGYAGTIAGGLWSAVPGVEQVHRAGRIGSEWFGDERLRAPSSRRDAMGNTIGYSRGEQRAISAGGAAGAALGGMYGGPLGAYVGQRVGEGVARRGADFAEGLTRGATEPIVERVNPNYPPPPEGGMDQINALQDRLARILEARANAEAAQQSAAADASHHQANAAPLTQFDQRTTQTISATQAHQAAVQRRQQANEQRQQREGDVSTALADAQQRRTGLSTLTIPLGAFQDFSSLGEYLPDGIPFYSTALVGPKRKIRQINRDATDFLNALNGVDATITEQQAATGPRQQETAQHAGRLGTTQTQAGAAHSSLQGTRQQGQALARRNQQRTASSRAAAGDAAAQGARLDGEAQRTQSDIQTTAERWQAWAAAHRQAREAAIAQRRRLLEDHGYRVREVSGQ
ncbi:MAG TPA: hypothetical protein VNU21_14520 [Usitatibacter sp.]|nr:hypothetical protein [Usitatibacter sp.]